LHLAEFLLEEGYAVFTMACRASTDNFARREHIRPRVELGTMLAAGQLEFVANTPLEEGLPRALRSAFSG